MLAIDANVIVRYLVGDHPTQSAKARALIDQEDVFVSTTVMLETEWVLRSVYGYTPPDVCRALRSFAGLPGVSVDDPVLLASAIDRTRKAWILPMRCIWGAPTVAMLSQPSIRSSSGQRKLSESRMCWRPAPELGPRFG